MVITESFIAHENCPTNSFLYELASAFHRLDKRAPGLTLNIVECTIDRIPLGNKRWQYTLKVNLDNVK